MLVIGVDDLCVKQKSCVVITYANTNGCSNIFCVLDFKDLFKLNGNQMIESVVAILEW